MDSVVVVVVVVVVQGWVGREVGVGGEGLSGNEAEVP